PWPWDDSRTTDFAYAFEAGKVVATSFGRGWFDPHRIRTDDEVEQANKAGKVDFPNMVDRQNVTFGERSGMIVVVSHE
ncbi:MAG TPA: hypothetical protein VNH83_31205, partial [Bryobacteraceae bacterium]|nr:hypothetical protein [Bryobacteraceae bacterium]